MNLGTVSLIIDLRHRTVDYFGHSFVDNFGDHFINDLGNPIVYDGERARR